MVLRRVQSQLQGQGNGANLELVVDALEDMHNASFCGSAATSARAAQSTARLPLLGLSLLDTSVCGSAATSDRAAHRTARFPLLGLSLLRQPTRIGTVHSGSIAHLVLRIAR